MRRYFGPLLLITLLLTACGSGSLRDRPSPAPAPAPQTGKAVGLQPVEPPQPAKTPEPERTSVAGAVKAGAFCNTELPATQRAEALQSALPAVLKGWTAAEIAADWEQQGDPAPCFSFDEVTGQDAFLMHGQFGVDGSPVLFGWQTDGEWLVARLAPLPDEYAAIERFTVGQARFPGGEPELYLVGRTGGTGGYAALLHATLASGEQLDLSPMITLLEKASYEFVAENLVLVTYRGEQQGPLAWECNGCMPVADQLLVELEGSLLSELGQRTYAYPIDTLNYLLGAIKAGDRERAILFVTDPGLVDQIAALVGDPMEWGPNWEDPDSIQPAEMHNWDLLPTAVRTALTEAQRKALVPIRQSGGKRTLFHMIRHPERGWLVESVNQ